MVASAQVSSAEVVVSFSVGEQFLLTLLRWRQESTVATTYDGGIPGGQGTERAVTRYAKFTRISKFSRNLSGNTITQITLPVHSI